MMPIRDLTLFTALILTVAACGGDTQESVAGEQPVPLWSADSPHAAVTDSTGLADGAADDAAAVVAVGAATPEIGAPAASPSPPPAETETTARPPSAQPAVAVNTTVTAEAILLQAERAYNAVQTLRAGFTQELTVPLLGSTHHSSGDLYHRKPDRFAMRFTNPAGDLVVADGTYLWAYYPSTDAGQVLRGSSSAAGGLDLQREFLSNPTERFDATLDGSESVGGRTAHVLTLVPRSPAGYSSVRIWIDAEDYLARRFEVIETNDNIRRVELQNLRVNVDLPEGIFQFTPPPGAQIFEQ